MNITVYRVGNYEVIRQTDDAAPGEVFFTVRVVFPNNDLARWGVNVSAVQSPSSLRRMAYRLQVALVRYGFIRIDDGPMLAKLESSLTEAFAKACHYAEELAGVSRETSLQIDEHAQEIWYRRLAQAEVDEKLFSNSAE